MSCDGAGRNAWDIKIPVSSSHFGESNESGYFYSQYCTCSYKDGAGRNELDSFLPMHSAKIKSSNLEGTGYHYGVYFDRRSQGASHSDVPANLAATAPIFHRCTRAPPARLATAAAPRWRTQAGRPTRGRKNCASYFFSQARCTQCPSVGFPTREYRYCTVGIPTVHSSRR